MIISHGVVHIIGLIVVCSAIWNMRNKLCEKSLRDPTEVLCFVCSFLKNWRWTNLQKPEISQMQEDGVTMLQEAVLNFHPHQGPSPVDQTLGIHG